MVTDKRLNRQEELTNSYEDKESAVQTSAMRVSGEPAISSVSQYSGVFPQPLRCSVASCQAVHASTSSRMLHLALRAPC